MSTSVSSVIKHFPSAENGFSTTTSGTVSSGATTVGLNSVAGYENGEVVVFVIDPTDSTKKQTFTGTIDSSGVQVTGVVWTAGTNQTHDAGATVVDWPSASHISMISKGLLVEHNQDGSHGAISATSLNVTSAVTTDTVSEKTSGSGVTVDGLNIKDSKLNTNNSVVTANITDAAITYAKLLTTIFSGQVSSYANGGTAGGTFYYANIGGIKLFWGATASILFTGPIGTTKTVTLPTDFYSTAPTIVTGINQNGDQRNLVAVNTLSATSATVSVWNESGTPSTGANAVWLIAIGT